MNTEHKTITRYISLEQAKLMAQELYNTDDYSSYEEVIAFEQSFNELIQAISDECIRLTGYPPGHEPLISRFFSSGPPKPKYADDRQFQYADDYGADYEPPEYVKDDGNYEGLTENEIRFKKQGLKIHIEDRVPDPIARLNLEYAQRIKHFRVHGYRLLIPQRVAYAKEVLEAIKAAEDNPYLPLDLLIPQDDGTDIIYFIGDPKKWPKSMRPETNDPIAEDDDEEEDEATEPVLYTDQYGRPQVRQKQKATGATTTGTYSFRALNGQYDKAVELDPIVGGHSKLTGEELTKNLHRAYVTVTFDTVEGKKDVPCYVLFDQRKPHKKNAKPEEWQGWCWVRPLVEVKGVRVSMKKKTDPMTQDLTTKSRAYVDRGRIVEIHSYQKDWWNLHIKRLEEAAEKLDLWS